MPNSPYLSELLSSGKGIKWITQKTQSQISNGHKAHLQCFYSHLWEGHWLRNLLAKRDEGSSKKRFISKLARKTTSIYDYYTSSQHFNWLISSLAASYSELLLSSVSFRILKTNMSELRKHQCRVSKVSVSECYKGRCLNCCGLPMLAESLKKVLICCCFFVIKHKRMCSPHTSDSPHLFPSQH